MHIFVYQGDIPAGSFIDPGTANLPSKNSPCSISVPAIRFVRWYVVFSSGTHFAPCFSAHFPPRRADRIIAPHPRKLGTKLSCRKYYFRAERPEVTRAMFCGSNQMHGSAFLIGIPYDTCSRLLAASRCLFWGATSGSRLRCSHNRQRGYGRL